MSDPKFWARSKTVLLSVLGALASLALAFDPIRDQVRAVLGDRWASVLGLISAALVILNRQFTAGGLTTRKDP